MDRWGEWMCQQVDMAHQFRVQQMLRPARREAGPTLQIHEAVSMSAFVLLLAGTISRTKTSWLPNLPLGPVP